MHERCALHNYSLAQNSLYRAPRNDPTPFVDIATVAIAGLGSTPQSGFVVDLGAGVRDSDPCFPLFDAGYAGLMVDGDPAQRPKMRQRIPSSRVAQEIALLSPANVAGMLRAAGAPSVPDLVKIDIDSFDCAVIAALLDAYKPKAIVMEANIHFPPPMRFALLRADRYDSERRGCAYGCSLAYQAALLKSYGYTLLQLEWNNAIYVRADAAARFAKAGMPHVGDVCAHYLRGFAARRGVYAAYRVLGAARQGPRRRQPPGQAVWNGGPRGRHAAAAGRAPPRTAKQHFKRYASRYGGRTFMCCPRRRRRRQPPRAPRVEARPRRRAGGAERDRARARAAGGAAGERGAVGGDSGAAAGVAQSLVEVFGLTRSSLNLCSAASPPSTPPDSPARRSARRRHTAAPTRARAAADSLFALLC